MIVYYTVYYIVLSYVSVCFLFCLGRGHCPGHDDVVSESPALHWDNGKKMETTIAFFFRVGVI